MLTSECAQCVLETSRGPTWLEGARLGVVRSGSRKGVGVPVRGPWDVKSQEAFELRVT